MYPAIRCLPVIERIRLIGLCTAKMHNGIVADKICGQRTVSDGLCAVHADICDIYEMPRSPLTSLHLSYSFDHYPTPVVTPVNDTFEKVEIPEEPKNTVNVTAKTPECLVPTIRYWVYISMPFIHEVGDNRFLSRRRKCG
jgi:hypothetical protein